MLAHLSHRTFTNSKKNEGPPRLPMLLSNLSLLGKRRPLNTTSAWLRVKSARA
ncbi:hypothetical protein AZE42_08314 [Rhizopogon vesiculosus]|uniref:Uncharacterized protein n=1 Tax=Rhizopogon vesiculosus TaxID=180088 RepID=A0A1J8Q9K5_9AGAM|nr:hypothetical protein AZE42_08314 [Rhizopogon vesiculosus]